jgi:ABC-type multidrug transport system fused ATPase/permease subunit
MRSKTWAFVIADVLIGAIIFLSFYILASTEVIFSDFYNYYLYYFGLMFAGAASLIFAFVLRFPVEPGFPGEEASMGELARRVRVAGYSAKERPREVAISFDSWTGVNLRYGGKGSDRHLYYTLDATSTSISVILILFLLAFPAVIAVPFSAFLLYRTLKNAGACMPKALGGDYKGASTATYGSEGQEIKERLMDSLSEARRVAEEAHHTANSAYQDLILLAIALVGMIGGLVLFILFSQTALFEIGSRAAFSFIAGMAISWIACALLLRTISKRMRPRVRELKDWVSRLDAALGREQMHRPDAQGEAAIEVLFAAYDELPYWLKVRRKSVLIRSPSSYILMWLLSIWAASVLIASISAFSFDFKTGMFTFLMGVAMASAAYLLYRHGLKQADLESTALTKEWEQRRKDLSQAVEERLGGM